MTLRTILIGASVLGVGCDRVFGLTGREPEPPEVEPTPGPFDGCFRGLVTQPSDGGMLTVILDQPEGSTTLTGCLISTEPVINVDITGQVKPDDPNSVEIAAIIDNRTARWTARRVPAGDAAAEKLVAFTEIVDTMLDRADELPRCPEPAATCAAASLPQTFAPGGAQ